MFHWRQISSCALLLVMGAELTAQKSAQESAQASQSAQVSAEARSALAAAKELATSLVGVRGEDRQAGLSRAAMAYDAVAEKFSGEVPAVSVALFEGGELWRRHGSLEKAEQAYRQVLAKGDKRYLGRATFQLAQMQRRLKRYQDAIKTYRQAAEVQAKLNRANEARIWIARCFVSLDQPVEAMQSFRTAVENAATPRQKIEASNYLAKALIKSGDLAAATTVLGEIATEVSPLIEAGGKDSERLQAALGRMSAHKALQQAKDKANGAAGDAKQLESDRLRAKGSAGSGSC